MCGIYACISKNPTVVPEKLHLLLRHRGPDHFSIFSSPAFSTQDMITNQVLSNTGPSFSNVLFASSVLSMRSSAPTIQPQRTRDACGNGDVVRAESSVMCWNGEAWKIGGSPVSGNDTQAIFRLLASSNSHLQLLDAIRSVSGPFSLIFLRQWSDRSCFYFCRDRLGRRSLLQRRDLEQGSLSFCSVGDGQSGWEEVPADGIYWTELGVEEETGQFRPENLALVRELWTTGPQSRDENMVSSLGLFNMSVPNIALNVASNLAATEGTALLTSVDRATESQACDTSISTASECLVGTVKATKIMRDSVDESTEAPAITGPDPVSMATITLANTVAGSTNAEARENFAPASSKLAQASATQRNGTIPLPSIPLSLPNGVKTSEHGPKGGVNEKCVSGTLLGVPAHYDIFPGSRSIQCSSHRLRLLLCDSLRLRTSNIPEMAADYLLKERNMRSSIGAPSSGFSELGSAAWCAKTQRHGSYSETRISDASDVESLREKLLGGSFQNTGNLRGTGFSQSNAQEADARGGEQPSAVPGSRVRFPGPCCENTETPCCSLGTEQQSLGAGSDVLQALNISKAKVAVLFSGGLDCTVLARLLSDILPAGEEIDLINVAFENPRIAGQFSKEKRIVPDIYEECPDRITGRRAFEELKGCCPERRWRFIAANIPFSETSAHKDTVVALMAPHNTEMDLSIANALYFAARGTGHFYTSWESDSASTNPPATVGTTAARVLFSGLGADELFGGYIRHSTAFSRRGYAGLVEELRLDMARIGQRNLGRDDRVLSHWSREVRFPFLDEDLVRWAIQTPVQDKCDFHVDDELYGGIEAAKRVLRLVADDLGLHGAAREKKRAIQFGARTAKMQSGRVKGTAAI
ncbi:hypothetical protein TD95_003668 [Thielaviopsis punctulata]|uniref:Glutamine amidotransferase type-2 domain-containing protein n=1 Tax=Thielaviopsis punctulata TaxID=72032 RepID=A0A0F4ZKQ7_9PEZI|nr:hypothetical protein TD95_003668 [Thielaviopsis punctulata]